MDEGLSLAYVQLGKAHWSADGPSTQTVLRRKSTKENINVPRDPCNCIYMALVLAGAGFLLPYNSFIIAVDYFQVSEGFHGTWIAPELVLKNDFFFQSRYPGTTIVFDMSLVYILMAFFAVMINNFLVESLSLHVRISFGYILAFFTLLFVAVLEIWCEAFPSDISYNVNLIAVAVVACGCTGLFILHPWLLLNISLALFLNRRLYSTVQQSSFYGYTSMLPARYTQAVMTGESECLLMIFTSPSCPDVLRTPRGYVTTLLPGFNMFYRVVAGAYKYLDFENVSNSEFAYILGLEFWCF